MTIDLLAYLAANPTAIGGSSSTSPFLAGQNAWCQGWFRDPPQPEDDQPLRRPADHVRAVS
jgi:hypothetical protein